MRSEHIPASSASFDAVLRGLQMGHNSAAKALGYPASSIAAWRRGTDAPDELAYERALALLSRVIDLAGKIADRVAAMRLPRGECCCIARFRTEDEYLRSQVRIEPGEPLPFGPYTAALMMAATLISLAGVGVRFEYYGDVASGTASDCTHEVRPIINGGASLH